MDEVKAEREGETETKRGGKRRFLSSLALIFHAKMLLRSFHPFYSERTRSLHAPGSEFEVKREGGRKGGREGNDYRGVERAV